jgi:hypothetical protein
MVMGMLTIHMRPRETTLDDSVIQSLVTVGMDTSS